MINSSVLWKQRFIHYLHEMKRYLRYMFNDHLLFVLLVGIGAGAVVYQRWVEKLPPQFPYAFVAALIFSLFLTHSPVRTFFKEADVVFLLPVEKQLTPYIQRAFVFSFIMQAYVLLLIMLVIAPLHLKFSKLPIWGLFIVLLFMKSWNMFISWKGNYFVEPNAHRFSWGARVFLNGLFTYFVLTNAPLIFSMSLLLIMAILSIYFLRATKQKGLKWERLIQQEEKKMLAFYRLANLFTDVPHLKERAKRRRWLDALLSLISYRQENAFVYLYMRTFLRAGDYFALYIRLMVIACFLLYIVPSGYGKIVTSVFFLYATGFQLFALSRHHRANMVVKLYPLPHFEQKRAVLRVLFQLLTIQSFLFALFLLFISSPLISLLSLAIGIAFSYFMLFIYFNKRWK